MNAYPPDLPQVNGTAPVPRRIRAVVAGHVLLDTTAALYVWEKAAYPQYYIPAADIDPAVLVDEQHEQNLSRGAARRHAVRVGDDVRPAALRIYGRQVRAHRLRQGRVGRGRRLVRRRRTSPRPSPRSLHPRRRDTQHPARAHRARRDRPSRIQLAGARVRTGLPTRFYLNRTEVDFTHLRPSNTVTACPYKGTASGYWSVQIGDTVHPDLAWTYNFPTGQLQPIAGLIAFYDEKVDTILDGQLRTRPVTHFS